jgi:TRAP-type C4-dicarboxylate transport system permease small subunit
MNKYLVEIENRLSDEWKFAIKNASLLFFFSFLLYFIISIISTLIRSIISSNDLELIALFLQFVTYISGYIVFIAVLFRVLLNFLNYYKEK